MTLARSLTAPLGLAFSVVTAARQKLYAAHVLKTVKLSKPVVSVGNLTVGGTGKTPFVDVLLTDFERRGLRSAVLTRGYGRKSSQPLLVTSATPPEEVGDEPYWLFQRHPNAKVAVSADRAEGARLAADADIFILDDGLQHFQVERDVNIALIDATRPLDHYRPLPWGYARESLKSLSRCDLVVITRSNQTSVEHLDEIVKAIHDHEVDDVVLSTIEWAGATDLFTGCPVSLEGRRVHLVSGIGNPQSFEDLVANVHGVTVAGHSREKDHISYSSTLIASLVERAHKARANLIVITEKDAVKWKNSLASEVDLPIAVAHVRFAFNPELPDIYGLATHHRR